MQSQETARSLYRRCQHGSAEALRALLLSTADGLYSAALAASADEAQAQELAAQTWEAFLGGLGRGKPHETAELQLQQTLGVEIAGELDEAAAARAVRLWTDNAAVELLAAPAELMARLEELSRGLAPAIQRRARTRRALLWAGRTAALLGLALIVAASAVLAGRISEGRTRDLQFAALRQRAQAERLTWEVRDTLLDLPDPEGADRYEAGLLAQVELLLEDLAAGPALSSRDDLRNLQTTLRQDDLLWRLRETTADAPEAHRKALAETTLLLEEAQEL
jgi:hypothetical protein